MTDIEIIKEIEEKIGVTLARKHKIARDDYGSYVLDKNQVIALHLKSAHLVDYKKIGFYLGQLKQLKELDLSNNQLLDITSLKELKQLTRLKLDNNKITDVSPLMGLDQLTYLSLDVNQLTDISSLKGLSKLKNLGVLKNKLTDISCLKNFGHLEFINLGRNYITNILPLEKLEYLKTLWLIGNNVETLSIIGNFTRLEELSLGETKLKDIAFLKNLKTLKRLDLQNNLIENISQIKDLPNLVELELSNNQIKDISALKDLRRLTSVSLQGNPINSLPPWVTELNMEIEWEPYSNGTKCIFFYNNPLESPPVEIVKQGKEAIKRYFDKIREEGIDYIYEAKLTLVGEGSSGKTSLQKRLLNEQAALPRNDKRTRGIEIKDWLFKKEKGKTHIVHIWDFGGQDVYYPVHRFFITENSVFVLLASTRQTHHNFDYWIPTIYQFGGKSPIILGQTCHAGNSVSWNDLGTYVGNPNFNIIKTQVLPYTELNLPNKNEGLQKIKQIIIDQISSLPHYGKGVPKSWVPVRNVLLEESKKAACITFEKFKELCQTSNSESFVGLTDITDCCQFLQDIGAVLWYSANEELKNWVILQPEWAMNAVYKIIDDEEIQKRRGNIIARDFTRLWKDDFYADKHLILKKMLEIFKIAFPKKHKQEDYIIPARLLSMPNEKKWQDNELYLRLEYRYEFMPRGMVNQVSAELSRYIVSDEEVWNNAVNFDFQNNMAQCQVEEDFYNRKITIKSKGKDARGLMMLVMDALKNITDGYKGVKPEIYVPCTCNKCINNTRPTTFLYDKLLEWSEKGPDTRVICNESGASLLIEELLYNVGLAKPSVRREGIINNKTITLFLASSSELEKDRRDFEIFINRENKKLNKEGIFIKLELWEDFIDAMSQTRLQDEYNKAVTNSDIFVCLFFTKVGKYTAEEFETAFGQFKRSGKPLVYTYFKDGQISMSKVKKADIDSKDKFEQKLRSLGHFPTSYENIDALRYNFKMQLEKILPDL